MYVCMYVCVHAGRYGWMHEWLAGWLAGWMDGCMHACMDGWMGGWVDEWMYMGRGKARTSLGVFVLNLGCRTAFCQPLQGILQRPRIGAQWFQRAVEVHKVHASRNYKRVVILITTEIQTSVLGFQSCEYFWCFGSKGGSL